MLGKVNFPIQEVDQLTIVESVMDDFLGSTPTPLTHALWQVPRKRPSSRGLKATLPTSSLLASITFKCHGGTSTLTGSMSNSRRSSTSSQSHPCLTNRFKGDMKKSSSSTA